MSNRFHDHRYGDKVYSPKYAKGNPGRKWKKVWSQRARAVQNHTLKTNRDFDSLIIDDSHKITSLYDWY